MDPQPPIPSRAKILVVDDDQVFLRRVVIALKPQGYQILTAANNADALALMRKEKPDLILFDLSFQPDATNIAGSLLDGLAIIEWLKHLDEAKGTPIIIISMTEPGVYQERAWAAGVSVCLQKPVDNNQLLEAINNALAQRPPSPQHSNGPTAQN